MSEDRPVAPNTLWRDSYIPYIPLLGAGIALTFDVGYFYAIDISFFTLFSLSEHIVFAIQAFPIALLVLIALSVFVLFWDRKTTPPPYLPGEVSRPATIIAYIVLSLLVLTLISILVFALYSAPVFILMTIVIVVAGLGIAFISKSAPYKQAYIGTMFALTALTVSFTFGLLDGANILSNDDPNKLITNNTETVTLKNGVPIIGHIIRSGDRGILLYDAVSNRVRFIMWDGTGSIEATPQKTITKR